MKQTELGKLVGGYAGADISDITSSLRACLGSLLDETTLSSGKAVCNKASIKSAAEHAVGGNSGVESFCAQLSKLKLSEDSGAAARAVRNAVHTLELFTYRVVHAATKFCCPAPAAAHEFNRIVGTRQRSG